MSTSSGALLKGEKGKKFQSLDINNLYSVSNKGESSDSHQQKSTASRKHGGMQPLGKVTQSRRAPVNLPSLKSEHSGNDPTLSLVPTGGTGWGSKPGETGPSPSTQPTQTSTSPVSTVNHGASAPVAVGTSVQPSNLQTQAPTTQAQVMMKTVTTKVDKTWSSVMSPPDAGLNFMATQSRFDQEFPSLSGAGAGQVLPGKPGSTDSSTGLSLRPQTEGNWTQGGTAKSVTPQHPYLPQETTGGSRNSNLGQFGVAGAQVGPSSSPPQSLPPQFKQIVPSFMQNMDNRNSGSAVYPPPVFPGNFQNNVRSRYNGSSENSRFSPGLRNLSAADSDEVVVSRPIIRDEDLSRIDEISRDTSWATQEHIDFNEKLDFRDDDSTGADDEKDVVKEKVKAHLPPKEAENEIDHIVHQIDKPWHGRGPPMPSLDYRGQLSRNIHPTRDEYEWEEKRKTSEKTIQSAVEKAKQRKEAEEKRFEESRSKNDEKLKKKEDSYGGNEWDKDDKQSPPVTTNKGPDSFRQMAQIETRGFNRDRAPFSKDVPPRFQNKPNQSYNRNQQQSNSNYGKVMNRRDYDLERDKPKDDDKERRDSRQTPEPDRYRQRNDRYDSRKVHYDNSDYSRHQKYDDRKDSDFTRVHKDVEWEGRRGNAWDTRHHNDDKLHARRDPKKFNDYNKGQSFFDERDDVRERPQRPDSREHPSRPDSRDSRLSRESRNSRESIREESSRNVETNHNYPWVDDYDKSLREDKNRKKDTFKEEPIKREIQPRRENRVFGPITPEKLEEHEKKSQARLEKEIIGTPLVGNVPKEESWSKLQPGNNTQSGASWNEPVEEVSKPADYSQTNEEAEKKEDTLDKVKELKDKDVKRLSTRGGRGGRQPYSITSNFLSSRHNTWNNRDSRRGGKPQRYHGSESDMSDEISASTESGKEDKKDRKQRPRSNERKKDKDDRNQVKKEEKPAARPERKQPIGSYEPTTARKEGFHPTGEPSRRGRGGGSMRGSRGNMGGHYGMPNTKSPFPTHSTHADHLKNEDDDKLDKNLSNDLTDFSIDNKNKPHSAIIIGFNKNQIKDQRKDMGKVKSKGKGSGDEDLESGSECSESEKGKQKQKFDKNKQRTMNDKRPFNTQINGRPSRVDDKDNGFQEVKSKKIVKEPRSSSKDDKRNRPKDAKGKSLQGPLNKPSAGKPFREFGYKPPRMLKKLHDVTELNKVNDTANVFPMTNNITSPAGPIPNAWEKPPKLTNSPTLHMSSTLNSVQEKSLETIDHVQSPVNSQTSSPAEKVLSKIPREGEKVLLPQTIVFENTNFKPHNDFAMKAKYSAAKGQRIEKGRGGKLDEELEGSALVISGTYKPGDLKSDKAQDSLHMAMSFNKNEDNADMKLDFQFDSDLTLSEEKSNTPHSIHLGQAADLNQKIASVKKVWDVDVMDQHHDESPGVVSTSSSSFTSNFGTTVDTSLDHSSSHPVDDSSFSNTDVYSATQIQASTNYGQTSNLMKPDPSNSAIKPQPTQAAVMSSALGNHSGPNLSSPPPQFPQSHFNYQNAYQNLTAIPSIPSPPTQAVISLGAQPVSNQQGELYHSFQLSTPMQGARSNYTGYPYGALGQNLGQSSAYGQQSLYHHVPPATNQPPPDLAYGPYRIPSGYGQSQQISNPAAVLITSSTSSSLMSASVKSTQTLGAIGTKAYQSNPAQVQLGYMAAYDAQMLPPNYLRAGSVPAALQQSTSFYSAGGQTGLFPPSSSLISTGNQPGMHSTFGMQGFNTAGSNQGPSSNQVGPNNYSSQMGHFRNASYIKPSTPVQHPGDSKSPSTQDMGLNCVFSVGGTGQIPSPKSRNSATGNSKPQVPSQQPSPTQMQQHKYTPYQQNMIMQGRNQLVGGYQRPGNNNMLNNNMGKYPQPIQRPQYSQQQQQQQYNMNQVNQPPRHRVQNSRQQPQHKMPNQYYPQTSNAVKIDGGSLDSKGDSDKLQDGSSATKVEKKDETAVNAEQ